MIFNTTASKQTQEIVLFCKGGAATTELLKKHLSLLLDTISKGVNVIEEMIFFLPRTLLDYDDVIYDQRNSSVCQIKLKLPSTTLH